MKLRLRSVETKETVRVDVPPSSTLSELKRRLSQALPATSASSPFSPDSVRLSLNAKDELQSSSPDESLHMLGITSGDLIYFTINPYVPESSISQIAPRLSSNLPVESTEKSDSINVNEISPVLSADLPEKPIENSDSIKLSEEALEEEEDGEFMEFDYADSVAVTGGKSFSVPRFLRKVLTEELSGDDGGRDHKLLLIAIHAVLLESGFVRFDPILNKIVSGFQSPNQWILTEPQRSVLCYTLPEIVDGATEQNSNVGVPSVELKFQTLGKFVIVYGSLPGSSSVPSVRLNEDHLVPFLNVAWSNCGLSEEIAGKDGLLRTSPEKEVFKFWMTVKDGLALPLLIDLCEKAGFGLPPCFMRLPTELKLKILELLPGVDLAKMCCLCSELQYLASNDELWKMKFMEQFGNGDRSGEGSHWKLKFATAWENRKRRKRMPRRGVFNPFGYITPPFMPWPPHFVGDRVPFGLPPPTQLASHVPRCNLTYRRNRDLA